MSQRDSGYERIERDAYETPEWVTRALVPNLPLESRPMRIWEPACGSGKMVRALEAMGHVVVASDISDGADFFSYQCRMNDAEAIITNPPYNLATEFIRHALELTARSGLVAMLLRTDFDHANSRRELFTVCPFWKKVVLTRRIKWFEESTGSPSFNHAWFIWNWRYKGPPMLAYGP